MDSQNNTVAYPKSVTIVTLFEALEDVMDAIGAVTDPRELVGYGMSEDRVKEIKAVYEMGKQEAQLQKNFSALARIQSEQARKTVNPHISDLFFNLDFDHAKVYEHRDGKRQFSHFNSNVMREEADTFLKNLEAVGVSELPSQDRLLEDFYDRV